jgi:hypothetical protein
MIPSDELSGPAFGLGGDVKALTPQKARAAMTRVAARQTDIQCADIQRIVLLL